ncbi:MAG: hypothetical protein NT007_08080 [Candidatus Kapabacteria bacterium]|nr:hypothetical protein [Candidatus Kapabacteria bacterium]
MIDNFNNEISIKVWCLLLISFLFLTFSLKNIINITMIIVNRLFNDPSKKEINSINQRENFIFQFSDRVSDAFPGVRGLEIFNQSSKAIRRLSILLKDPLILKSESSNLRNNDPVWWFRGSSANSISTFKIIGHKQVLMNFDQLKIKKIAVYHSNLYYQDFVYVEAGAEKPTGLYTFSQEHIKAIVDEFGYFWEEYGIIDVLFFFKKVITRNDYDDGSTIFLGKVIKNKNVKLRTKYLTHYNFIIADKDSPYNSSKFEDESEKYFNGILENTKSIEEFLTFLKTLSKYDNHINSM